MTQGKLPAKQKSLLTIKITIVFKPAIITIFKMWIKFKGDR